MSLASNKQINSALQNEVKIVISGNFALVLKLFVRNGILVASYQQVKNFLKIRFWKNRKFNLVFFSKITEIKEMV